MKTYLVQTVETRIETQTQQINAKDKTGAIKKAAILYQSGVFEPNEHTEIKVKFKTKQE